MLCPHCNKDIPEENLQIHEVNCRRNNTKCEKCQEIIPKSSYEDHFKEMHELKQCPNCGDEYENQYSQNHQCINPDVTCKYCEAVMKSSLMPEHVEYCENQTQECEKCKKYIKKKDFEGHQKINCLYVPPPPPVAVPAMNPFIMPNFNLFQNPNLNALFFNQNQNALFNPQFLQNSGINLANLPVIVIPANNSEEIPRELMNTEWDNLKGYIDDGGIALKGKLTILKGPRFSVLNRPRLKPTNRKLISSQEDYEDIKPQISK